MHKIRLERLARWLEAGAPHETIKFDMREGVVLKEIKRFENGTIDGEATMACGTSCCIAGAAVQFFNDLPTMLVKHSEDAVRLKKIGWSTVRKEAEELLGLTRDQSWKLFTPATGDWGRVPEHYNDPKWAGRVIRKLIETGEVDWPGCRYTEEEKAENARKEAEAAKAAELEKAELAYKEARDAVTAAINNLEWASSRLTSLRASSSNPA